MKNKNEKQKINKFIKPVIMPTASILTHITVDGIPDNNMIKTTFIKKNDSNKEKYQRDDPSIKNFLTDELIYKNKEEIVLEEEIIYIEEDFKNKDNFEPKMDFLESNNEINITNLSNSPSFNYSSNHYKKTETSSRSKKINEVKNEFKINELRGLMSNINYELTNRIAQKGSIVMSGHKFDENALYRQLETNYECRCHSCQKLNLFRKAENKNFKNVYVNIDNIEQIELKPNSTQEEVEDNSFDDLRNFLPEYDLNFSKNNHKIEKEPVNETIYSQSILNEILNNKICESNEEFLIIFNSLDKKKSFLNDLKKGKFGLNEANKLEIVKMIQRLKISEKQFINNNVNFSQWYKNYGK